MGIVQELRKKGYKLRVTHFRRIAKVCELCHHHEGIELRRFGRDSKILVEGETLLSRGGETVVDVTTPDGDQYVTKSMCAVADAFNKKVGTLTAIKKALAEIQAKKNHSEFLAKNRINEQFDPLKV